jgi:catechol 2,3-dioxygenase-like lactoylglutathione lyase family enzyme
VEVTVSGTDGSNGGVSQDTSGGRVDMNLEVVVLPVADVERAKEFYGGLGWRLDADVAPGGGFRLVQYTPPGSGCSVQFGTDLIASAPGSSQSAYLVVSDIKLAREDLVGRGVKVSEVFHEKTLGDRYRAGAGAMGASPDASSYGSFASFSDPDGNGWLLQEVTTRLPGRVDATSTSYGSKSELADALRRAEAAHGEHEKRLGHADADWSDWYADYMVDEQVGGELAT